MERILIDHLIHLIDVETKAQQSEMPEPSSRTGSFFLVHFPQLFPAKSLKCPVMFLSVFRAQSSLNGPAS